MCAYDVEDIMGVETSNGPALNHRRGRVGSVRFIEEVSVVRRRALDDVRRLKFPVCSLRRLNTRES